MQSPELRHGQMFASSKLLLQPAEAALAGHVVAGEVLKRTSETLQVSMNTAKTHLKRIFEKTGTRRQAELVHLVLTSPAQVRLRPLKITPHHLGDNRFIGVETNSRSQKPV